MRKVLFTPKRNTTAPAFEEISSFDQKRYNKRTTAAKGALEGKVGESEVAESFKFLCPLCLKLINKCMTTVCGHSFCERCIDEYTILKPVSTCVPRLIDYDLCRLASYVTSTEKRECLFETSLFEAASRLTT